MCSANNFHVASALLTVLLQPTASNTAAQHTGTSVTLFLWALMLCQSAADGMSVGCSLFMTHSFEHLACFIPAMLALGAQEGAVTGIKAERYLSLAKDLTYTCWQMYARHATGVRLPSSATGHSLQGHSLI